MDAALRGRSLEERFGTEKSNDGVEMDPPRLCTGASPIAVRRSGGRRSGCLRAKEDPTWGRRSCARHAREIRLAA